MNCSEPPMLEDHMTRTPCGLVSEGSSAGLGPVGLLLNQSSGFMLGRLEHAASATASSKMAIRRGMPAPRLSSAKGVEAHLHALAERAVALWIRFLEREAISGFRLIAPVLGNERVAAQRGVLAGERRRVLRLEELERLVVALLVDQHAGEAQPRDVAHLLRPRALDHPLQLRLRVLQVAALEVKAGGGERTHRSIERAREGLDQRAARLAQRLRVAPLQRLEQGLVQGARLPRLAVLPVLPGPPACER